MTDADARIRPFVQNDKKRIQFTVGKATMEGLTVANRKGTRRYSLTNFTRPHTALIVSSDDTSSDHCGLDSALLYPRSMVRLVAAARVSMVDLPQASPCVCIMVRSTDVFGGLVRNVLLSPPSR